MNKKFLSNKKKNFQFLLILRSLQSLKLKNNNKSKKTKKQKRKMKLLNKKKKLSKKKLQKKKRLSPKKHLKKKLQLLKQPQKKRRVPQVNTNIMTRKTRNKLKSQFKLHNKPLVLLTLLKFNMISNKKLLKKWGQKAQRN